MKKTGACWVILGDTYNNAGTRGGTRRGYQESKNVTDKHYQGTTNMLPEKSLCMIPERFAIAMVDRGWILRNKIIWHKPNCMPSSAKDRFTVDWEYVFFFTKSQRYYFETQYETQITKQGNHILFGGNKRGETDQRFSSSRTYSGKPWILNDLGRIKRCVWKIPTKPFKGAHFAVFPEQLIETPIKSTCPEYVCTKCGVARQRIFQEVGTSGMYKPQHTGKYGPDGNPFGLSKTSRLLNRDRNPSNRYRYEFKEMSDCGCGAAFEPGVCLDPFMGAGTTGLVALRLARRFVGIELNQDYIELANKRVEPWLNQLRFTN